MSLKRTAAPLKTLVCCARWQMRMHSVPGGIEGDTQHNGFLIMFISRGVGGSGGGRDGHIDPTFHNTRPVVAQNAK